jgi:hypothetical protein
VWINLFVVGHIVFVITGGGKNRSEVERGDAQFLQVVQVLDNSLEVAAEKLGAACFGIGSLSPGTGDHRFAVAEILATAHIIGGITIGEAIRENLVEDAALQP